MIALYGGPFSGQYAVLEPQETGKRINVKGSTYEVRAGGYAVWVSGWEDVDDDE